MNLVTTAFMGVAKARSVFHMSGGMDGEGIRQDQVDENERRQVDRWRQGGLIWLFVIVGLILRDLNFDFRNLKFLFW